MAYIKINVDIFDLISTYVRPLGDLCHMSHIFEYMSTSISLCGTICSNIMVPFIFLSCLTYLQLADRERVEN